MPDVRPSTVCTKRRPTFPLAAALLFAIPVGSVAQTRQTPAAIIDLGTLPGGFISFASGLSADGRVVVGGSLVGVTTQAFRWTQAGGMTGLGSLNGGTSAFPTAVDANGAIVVGYASDGLALDADRAFRWTAAKGIVSLGTLNGGSMSRAYGVDANGAVVVGLATDGAALDSARAFRWTAAGGMVSLGTLNGGDFSQAVSVSANGAVVVGSAEDGALPGTPPRAFRWTRAGGMVSLGTLPGGDDSHAFGVSSNGLVVVGSSNDGAALFAERAFRWTKSGGMVSLGTLNNGETSFAAATNANGAVVVGTASDGSAGNVHRAFRWTRSTGLTSVDQWLRTGGVALPSDVTDSASGVSADGNVIAGNLTNNHAFLARGATAERPAGLMDVAGYEASLAGVPRLTAQEQSADLVINGAHSSPMLNLLPDGRSSVWTAGDLGRTASAASVGAAPEGSFALGEIGIAHAFAEGVIGRMSAGTTFSQQALAMGGTSRSRGGFIVPEMTLALGHGVYATGTGYYNDGSLAVARGYTNGAGVNVSAGSSGTQSYAGRARIDWLNATRVAGTDVSPYVSITRIASHLGSMTETGGAFPSMFAGADQTVDIARLGADALYRLTPQLALLGRSEYAHGFDKTSAAISGQILGLSTFDLPGTRLNQNWVRGGLGAEIAFGPGAGLIMMNASNQTTIPTYWLNASYRVMF